MKPLGVLSSGDVRCHQYVDDTQFYLSVPSDLGEATVVLDQSLEAVVGWMWPNKLRLNPEKAEVLCVPCLGGRETDYPRWACTPLEEAGLSHLCAPQICTVP